MTGHSVPIVDANVHLAAVRGPAGAAGWQADWPPGHTLTLETYRDAMRSAGIARSVLTTTIRVDGFDNAYTAASAASDLDAFRFVGNIDIFAEDALRELARWAEDWGMRGARLYGGTSTDAAEWLDDARALAAWRAAEELGLVVSAQRTRAANLAPLRRMLDRMPDVPVLVYSAGDPSVIEGSPEVDELCTLAMRPNVVLVLSISNLRTGSSLLERLAGSFGPDRLMWGSYSMFRGARDGTIRLTLTELIESVGDHFSFLSPLERSSVLGGTAASVFWS